MQKGLWWTQASLWRRGKGDGEVVRGTALGVSGAGTYEPGKAMQARLLERPQHVKSMNSKASKADPPKNPATTRPRTYAPIDRLCRHARSAQDKCRLHDTMLLQLGMRESEFEQKESPSE